ncbi:MAG: hypothetical protein ACXV4Z_07220 [Halobacteriota archaeon]
MNPPKDPLIQFGNTNTNTVAIAIKIAVAVIIAPRSQMRCVFAINVSVKPISRLANPRAVLLR